MSLIESFQKTYNRTPRIGVIGDVMLDRHLRCKVLGLSPEDDLAYKLQVLQEVNRPGGAANVALNLKKLGAEVQLFGTVGRDASAGILTELLHKQEIRLYLESVPCTPTTTKTRYMTDRGRHVARVDEEQIYEVADRVVVDWQSAWETNDLLVVSDYAKGVVNEFLLRRVWQSRRPFIVDPKRTELADYGSAWFITPNEKEANAAYNDPVIDIYTPSLLSRCEATSLLITLASAGALYCHKPEEDEVQEPIKVRAREVGDPCGCGDSLLACLAYSLACGVPEAEAVRIAVAAGACAVDHVGAYAVTRENIEAELNSFAY